MLLDKEEGGKIMTDSTQGSSSKCKNYYDVKEDFSLC